MQPGGKTLPLFSCSPDMNGIATMHPLAGCWEGMKSSSNVRWKRLGAWATEEKGAAVP